VSLLSVRDLRSGYGKLPVLHGVSMDVASDEVVAVVGPNGAGKSSLLKTIFQVLEPMEGTITLDGADLGARATTELARLGMGYVPQGGNTFPDLNVEENLRVALTAHRGLHVRDGLRLAYETFPVLKDRRQQRASTLSGGERQMLAIAGAIVSRPRLLALDEPTTGLAPTIVHNLIARILDIRTGGTAILWVIEENPLEILRHCDRVYLMQGGVFTHELQPDEILSSESLQQLFFGSGPGNGMVQPQGEGERERAGGWGPQEPPQ
jgi:ABC-type branched-subunit amino acid transport system ATPase component